MRWQLEWRRFLLWLLLVWACYATIEVLYITRMPLVMDEFQGAYSVHQFASALPYRDFDPYKTVLGYYAQLPALEAPHDLWRGMLAVKFEMAAAVLLTFLAVTFSLRRRFDSGPLLLSSAMLVAMSEFAERSGDLRVDMLTALAGLVAFVALLNRRPGAAGAIAAISVLISQKGVLFVVASGAVLAIDLIVDLTGDLTGDLPLEKDRGAVLRRGTVFAASFAVVMLAYLAIWSIASSPQVVLHAVFGTAARVARIEVYSIRTRFWVQTLTRNPLYWLLAVLSIPILLRRWRDPLLRSIGVYGAVILLLGVLYRQPWPYFFVILCPTVFVLHAALLQQIVSPGLRRIAAVGCLLLAVAYPLTRLRTTLERDSAEQRWTVEFAHAILAPTEHYFAGVDMLWDRDQEPAGWRWLDAGTAQQLQAKTPEQLQSIAMQIRRAPIKLVIGSYRTANLPAPLGKILDSDFQRLWGNVSIYAPRLRPGSFTLKFAGSYRLQSSAQATLDGHLVNPEGMVALGQGAHTLTSGNPVRLQLIPPGWLAYADPRFAQISDLYRGVYTY